MCPAEGCPCAHEGQPSSQEAILLYSALYPKGLPGILTTTDVGAVLEQKGRKEANTTFAGPEVEGDILFGGP